MDGVVKMVCAISTTPNSEQVKMPQAVQASTKKRKPSNQQKPISRLVSQTAAAAHCEVHNNEFRRVIRANLDFPIKEKSGNGSSWLIDLDELDAWRKKTGFLLPKESKSATPAEEVDNPSKDRARGQAAMIQMQVEERRGKLVEREWVKLEVSTVFAAFAREMDLAIPRIGKRLGLPKEAVALWRADMDAARDAAVLKLQNADIYPK